MNHLSEILKDIRMRLLVAENMITITFDNNTVKFKSISSEIKIKSSLWVFRVRLTQKRHDKTKDVAIYSMVEKQSMNVIKFFTSYEDI